MRAIRILAVTGAALAAALIAGHAVAGARDELTMFTKGLKGLDGQFSQQVFDANGKRKESSTGRVAMSAPRLFRWEYVKPYPQLIVADGKNVWVYDPDLRQVTKRAQGVEEQNSPLAALIDPSRLEKDFIVQEIPMKSSRVKGSPAKGGLEWLQLTPRNANEASFASASLGFGKAGLVQMQVIDSLGQRTLFSFSAWKRNPSFGKTTFRYTPPKGVDVVGDS